MASKQSTVDFIIEQIASDGTVRAKRMFGEYGIFCSDKMVALVCDDQLFVKQTAGGRAFASPCQEASPYPGAKPCLLISGDRWEDREWMSELIRITADELPAAKAKGRKAK